MLREGRVGDLCEFFNFSGPGLCYYERVSEASQEQWKEVHMSDRNPIGAFVVGFVVGGVSAAAAALLFTPQSGEETRTMIKDKSIELRDKAQHTYEETIAKAEAVINEATRQIRKQPDVEVKQPDEAVGV